MVQAPRDEATGLERATCQAAVDAVRGKSERKDSAGSAWNAAGTWEERDVLPKVRERIETVVKRVSDRDFGSGVISVDRVKSVTGDASVGVIRGKARQFLDVKIEVAFRVRVGGDDTAYKGTLTVKDYSADAATEPVDVEVKFSDAARVPRVDRQETAHRSKAKKRGRRPLRRQGEASLRCGRDRGRSAWTGARCRGPR